MAWLRNNTPYGFPNKRMYGDVWNSKSNLYFQIYQPDRLLSPVPPTLTCSLQNHYYYCICYGSTDRPWLILSVVILSQNVRVGGSKNNNISWQDRKKGKWKVNQLKAGQSVSGVAGRGLQLTYWAPLPITCCTLETSSSSHNHKSLLCT